MDVPLQKALSYVERGHTLQQAADILAPSRAYSWYLLLWRWATFHFDDDLQARAHKKLGTAKLYARINRCRAFITENTELSLPPLQ